MYYVIIYIAGDNILVCSVIIIDNSINSWSNSLRYLMYNLILLLYSKSSTKIIMNPTTTDDIDNINSIAIMVQDRLSVWYCWLLQLDKTS